MAKDNPKTIHFARHYKQLELDDRAGWDTARDNYRRLVHLWHPDRFAERPRERAHAQQQFINLTKSYNVLRNFYRKNKRLPFESAMAASNRESNVNMQDNSQYAENQDDSAPQVDASILARDPSDKAKTVSKHNKGKYIWMFAGGAVMLGTIMLFIILDRKANQAVAERGREVVKDAPQSEFLPSAAEIRRSQTRGAFVKPTK